ncbi:hypothetical protein WR25_22650 [Diploscapter pachys]|uniref:Uncharacterized protein n=1 Tax=Diploscapter pachys TaxID=2018661 RepID=A0A2A2KDG6_9BILA|nr:hypothetical protein WR25_22650 [Diploscapter pachys]
MTQQGTDVGVVGQVDQRRMATRDEDPGIAAHIASQYLLHRQRVVDIRQAIDHLADTLHFAGIAAEPVGKLDLSRCGQPAGAGGAIGLVAGLGAGLPHHQAQGLFCDLTVFRMRLDSGEDGNGHGASPSTSWAHPNHRVMIR